MSPLDIEFALRFCIWSTTAAAVFVFGHWAYALRSGRMDDVKAWAVIPLVAEAIKHAAWTVHQYWFSQSWVLFNADRALHAEFQASKWIVYSAEVVILLSMIGVLSPYLIARFGRWWPVAGCFVIAGLFGVGLWVGFPS
jgi:hypothetical protein